MTTIRTEMARLETDFNSVRDGETLVARFDFSGAASLPSEGERVQLYDGEGNRCFGVVVESMGEEHFRVRPIWDTWIDGDEIHQTPAPDETDLMDALRASIRHAGETGAVDTEVEEFKVKLG